MTRKYIPVLLTAIAVAASVPALAQTVVPVARFQSIELVGGGRAIVRHGPAHRVTILEGNAQISDIRVRGREERRVGRNSLISSDDRLVIVACRNSCPDRYKLVVEIQTPDVEALAVRGGGQIDVKEGFRRGSNLAVAVSGGGQIDARSLSAASFAAAVSGGGSLMVGPSSSLSAAVNGGGTIRYWGDPQLSTAVRGGGTVVRGGR
jgi:hypothetical protein